MNGKHLDCVVIGYNETPFEQYEEFLRQYGEDSEAYRDLKFSFVNVDERKLNYMGLLNHAQSLAANGSARDGASDEFKSCDIPNLAAAYLTHFLRKRNVEARYINLFQYEKEKLGEYLDQNPYCVAITTTFYVVNFPVSEMVEFIKARNPQVKVVVGGPLVANHIRNYQGDDSAAALADIGADIYVVEGQGELTLWQLVEALKQGGDLSRVPNIIYVEDGKLRRTETRPENNSLDENYINWLDFPEENLGVTLQTRTARSCAFKCSFCNYPTRAGALTLTSLELIEKELDSMMELGNVQNVVFIDDTFNVPFPRFKDICRMMIRKKYPFNWFSYFRCSNSDEEAIELMAESGCKGVFLGIESGSPTILKNMNKAATIEKYAQGIEWLRRYGILTFGSFIIGFPGETEETVQETIDFLKETKPDFFRAQLWYCEHGTPIELQRDKFGINGEGFVWTHNTMDSLEAMDHIDRIFLTTKDSIWLPQWSFDFWTIPYLLGRGITIEKFKKLMSSAHKLLALEIASVPEGQKRSMQQEYVSSMARLMAN
ncbi:MAG: anaerobic magnesium-protoporphyrin monomethyl ester cyclase [Blastocatellia bacterium]|jgi:p-methyltransferase|nr:anaerobic magnesium-protoporphyrin monomethyl ester cyclase [Blastocatellia bacterium]